MEKFYIYFPYNVHVRPLLLRLPVFTIIINLNMNVLIEIITLNRYKLAIIVFS